LTYKHAHTHTHTHTYIYIHIFTFTFHVVAIVTGFIMTILLTILILSYEIYCTLT